MTARGPRRPVCDPVLAVRGDWYFRTGSIIATPVANLSAPDQAERVLGSGRSRASPDSDEAPAPLRLSRYSAASATAISSVAVRPSAGNVAAPIDTETSISSPA